MASAIYISCLALRVGHKSHLTGPKSRASEALGMASSSPGSCRPARPSLRFSGMQAAAHTLTNIPRDLSQRLLFPDAPSLRNECRRRNKSPAKDHKEPVSLRPASSHQRAAGCAQGTAEYWLFMPQLSCHQTQRRKVILRDWRLLTNADSSQSIAPGQPCRS